MISLVGAKTARDKFCAAHSLERIELAMSFLGRWFYFMHRMIPKSLIVPLVKLDYSEVTATLIVTWKLDNCELTVMFPQEPYEPSWSASYCYDNELHSHANYGSVLDLDPKAVMQKMLFVNYTYVDQPCLTKSEPISENILKTK